MLDDRLLDLAVEVLEKRPKIVAAWLFGSQASGRARPDSDVDIAILAQEGFSTGEQLELATELEKQLGAERVDLVLLDASHPVLAFEAIRGRALLDRDPQAVSAFVSLISRSYEDVMANLRRGLAYRQQARGN